MTGTVPLLLPTCLHCMYRYNFYLCTLYAVKGYVECRHLKRFFFFSHSYHASWYYQSFTYSPTDALVRCLKKKNIKICTKIYTKKTPTCFGVTVTSSSSGSTLICARINALGTLPSRTNRKAGSPIIHIATANQLKLQKTVARWMKEMLTSVPEAWCSLVERR